MARSYPQNELTAVDVAEYAESKVADFQFELMVHRICKAHCKEVQRGGIYNDKATGKAREYDSRGTIEEGICVLRLAVECKNLQTHTPLVISRLPRANEGAFHKVVRSSRAQWTYSHTPIVIDGKDMFRPGEMVGKAVAQIRRFADTEGRGDKEKITLGWETVSNEVYEKWTQACAQAVELIEKAEEDAIRMKISEVETVVQPVLVVPDYTLWAIDYDNMGKRLREPQQVTECSYFLGKVERVEKRAIFEYCFSHLLIFTTAGFDDWLEHLIPLPESKYFKGV